MTAKRRYLSRKGSDPHELEPTEVASDSPCRENLSPSGPYGSRSHPAATPWPKLPVALARLGSSRLCDITVVAFDTRQAKFRLKRETAYAVPPLWAGCRIRTARMPPHAGFSHRVLCRSGR